MTLDRRSCTMCAWRGSCAKQFSRGDELSCNCPDFSEDVQLRRQLERENEAARQNPPGKT